MFLATEKPLERLLVTSPGPLEGKTSTAISMATVIAQSGRRVLIIDNDMRRPRLHKALDQENRVGLTNLLLGEKSAEEVICKTKIPDVSMLPCGPLPPNPTELLYTDRYKETIEMLEELFDVIVFDSPPINPVTDSTVLSSLVDGVVLVVRAGKTRKELLARAVDQLDGVQANILGAILNDVDISDKRYGYYYYYYRHYGQYYGTDDEEMLDQPLT
jgi:capsular exopolysaccharide synthesis family protein